MKGSGSSRAKNYVDSVTFDGPVVLTGAELRQVVTSLKVEEFKREANWLEKVQDTLRQPWLDHGYHKAEVIAKAAPVGGDDGRYAITAHVDEGLQYRVGRIDFLAEWRISQRFDRVRELAHLAENFRALP